MKYKTDKRTKTLTLRDIHVGDWVQVWSEQAERYSPPLKIIQICDDGTVYLIIDEENRLDPWEENIKDIDALPIDADLLRGFGFSELQMTNELSLKLWVRRKGEYFAFQQNGIKILFNLFHKLMYIIEDNHYPINYSLGNFHELQRSLYYEAVNIDFEWKGVEKSTTHKLKTCRP